MRADVDVVVVGAGAMGSAAAWWLARRGHDVVVVEQFAAGHDRGSSHGGARIFRHAYPDPHYVRLAKEALPLWRELEGDAGCTLLELIGGIDHGPSRLIEQLAAGLIGEGVDREVLSPGAAAERWPAMRFDEAVLFHPAAGRCLADATVAACQRRAAAHGAELHFETGPARIEPDAGGHSVTVQTGSESWHARVAVVAVGAWAGSLLGADLSLPPLKVTREQVQHFRPVDGAAEWPSFLHYRSAGPVVYGLRTPHDGVKVDEHHAGTVADPDDVGRPIDQARLAGVIDYVARWFPGLDPWPVNTSTCLYTTTPNEDFVIDRVGPIVLGSPCSGHGFKFVPLIGRMLADLADGTKTTADPRFALR